MKKEDVPQDNGSLGKVTREVCYATDSTGKYTTELSSGWDIKSRALDVAWNDIDNRITEARKKVEAGEASQLLFFMEYRLMDLQLVADYTGFWKWQIKRHLKPDVFKNLSDKKLQKYAEAFNVKVNDLKSMTVHES
ncbi:hypothetical protein [Mucilaginibacter sp. KACC 22063]|uniref:hypothetical protein n=1 Tax=Mucilaginibacter sp. KACC 22063 TaxID=3025666 RepID=UPI00236655FD|nr:hypothetical protein [Mucilaginibacter sp. KACC 22063]WDF55012.1 hypothetical protein PQ461_18955 [Mucilaginibacter sp. KACC 22063]